MQTDWGRVISQPIYDTAQFTAGALGAIRFFTIPQGQALGTPAIKGAAQTNLLTAGQLETGQKMVVEAIYLHPHANQPAGGATAADKLAIWQGVFRFTISGVNFLTIPVSEIGEGGSDVLINHDAASAGTGTNIFHDVCGNSANVYPLPKVITLEGTQQFSCTIEDYGTIANDTNILVVLLGTMTRPVV